jgi:AcrR family transcriptional regulator
VAAKLSARVLLGHGTPVDQCRRTTVRRVFAAQRWSSMPQGCRRRHQEARAGMSLALVPDPEASDMGDLERLETQLTVEFSPPLRPDEVRRQLLECVASYQSAVVRTYLPMLIERGTRERLRQLVASRQAQPHR